MRYPLSRYCFLLCKNCWSGMQGFSPNDKIGSEIGNRRTVELVQPRLSDSGIIKMLTAAEFENASSRNRAEPVEIWKTRKFIEEHSDERLSLRRAAKAVNIHPNYLSERFKQVTGMNFVEYVARTRFETAYRLLRDGELKISDIAFAAGFQSLSQFNRVFKRLSGKSPTQFRVGKRVVRRHR